MGGSEILGPLLRAGLVDLDQCSEAVKKRWCIFQVFLPPKLAFMAKIPALQVIMGGEENWGEEGDPAHQLAPFLASGSRQAVELRGSWQRMQQEADEAARFLGEVVEGPLAGVLEGARQAAEGPLRQAIVEKREQTRGKLLLQALDRHPDRSARPVWSWPERDKQSSAWLLCLPTADFTFSNQEFSTAAAALLCLPPPCTAPRVGENIGRGVTVCRWGDNLVNATMRGDGWRVRHDEMKLLIRDLHVRAGVPIVCEVFNLFADCIPQPELNRIERGRRRQALVPDFKVRGDGGEGDVLCELKFINACNTWYPRNPRPRNVMRGVKRRADRLTGEYGKKAQQVDQLHCGVPPPPPARAGVPRPPRQVGPVENRLNSFGHVRGWVFGAWGECSEEVHALVQKLAEAKVNKAATEPGHRRIFRSREAQLASEVSFLRRRLSFTAVQQQSRLLLDRLQLLGEGSREAARRRDWAAMTRRAEEKERRAQLVCLQQGRAIRRSGFGILD